MERSKGGVGVVERCRAVEERRKKKKLGVI